MESSACSTCAERESQKKRERNPYLEALLELGRNWALAVAICGAGLAAYSSETVNGPKDWQTPVFLICTLVALAWMVLATLRFDEAMVRALRSKYAHRVSFVVVVALLLLAFGLVWSLAKFSENRSIVKICDLVPTSEPSKIHAYDECVRLKAQRDELRKRLESE